MPPLRQPLTMVQLAQQQMVDRVVEAGQGLISTPGDPSHIAALGQLHLAVSRLPAASASLLSQAVLSAVDRALVLDYTERVTGEAMAFLGLEPLTNRAGDLLADVAGMVALSVPVDKEVTRALLVVAAACLPPATSSVDTSALSAAGVSAVVSMLHKMPRLDSLRLTSLVGPNLKGHTVYPLARALHCQQRLSVFSLPQSASDNVLRVLAQACADTLEELDVSYSRAVTDKGVAALVACANVRVIKLSGTSCTALGAERLVQGCPSLQNLGRVPDLGRALTAVVRGSDWSREELSLRTFKSDRPPPLPLLAEHCPRLEAVTVLLREGADYYRMPTLAALGDAVPGLQRLTLSCEEPGSNDLVAELLGRSAREEAVEVDNQQTRRMSDEANSVSLRKLAAPLDGLQVLKLRGTAIQVGDLQAIGITCPHLQRLVLQALPPSATSSQGTATQRLPQDAFRRLRIFAAEDLLPDAELLVLIHGHALEEIALGHFDPGVARVSFGDDALLDVLHENPLEQLRLFSVDEAPFLGVRSVRRLLECPQLKLVAHLDTWGQIAADEVEQLQLQADSCNLDVCLAGTAH